MITATPPLSSRHHLATVTNKASSSSLSSYLPIPKAMMKLWPSLLDQLTPRASADGREQPNPFDVPANPSIVSTATMSTPPPPAATLSNGQRTPGPSSPFHPAPSAGHSFGPLTPPSGGFAAAIPAPQFSLHVPDLSMRSTKKPSQLSNAMENKSKTPSSSTTSTTRTTSSSAPSSQSSGGSVTSKGQIHFEQNEFVSRDPTDEMDKEVKGIATALSRSSSSNAVATIGAQRSTGKSSTKSSPTASLHSGPSLTSNPPHPTQSLFGRLSAHNPVWKHEVSFDVTSEDSVVTFSVYDRVSDHHFLGTVQIKPVLIHDHTVDQWYKLLPLENEVVTGEMRVQITFEQYKTKRALTPRDFEFLKLIGRGTFGKVFQVRKRDTKRIYAMKVLSKKEIIAKKEVAHTIGERKILQRSLESPFLVGLKFSFQTDADLYLVTDFKSGGELFWHLQKETRFSEERARFYVAELVLALEHLHKYNIIYRDLKPENILLDATGHVALCDFGLSKADLRSGELTTTFCGTTEYLAPEVLLDEHGYSKLVDFWSLGVLLFEMCCGWSPFYAEDTQQMYKNICFGKIRFPRNVISEEGKLFVKGLLNRNPKHRLGAERDAAELKEHPFFASIDWKALSMKQVTPPFKPAVESDESTSNFDPEFTTADIRHFGFDIDGNRSPDEEDPSDDWTYAVSGPQTPHTPNGPLGCDRLEQPNGTNVHGQGIQIKRTKQPDVAGTPLTSSVQENFRGFTYSGGESFVVPAGFSREDDESEDDDEANEPTTEDEYEDESFVGRYSSRRRRFEDDIAD
ncbi:kinase-like protein [Pisolithus croceorrhizus]|nr:kinase-like protein [Pisolithus croceorrhizus]